MIDISAMIELSIKISDSETKTIWLTDTKPLVRTAIAIFWEGKVYYAPVVDKDACLDSGIRVYDPTKTPAVRGIAFKPFDPLYYDACNSSEYVISHELIAGGPLLVQLEPKTITTGNPAPPRIGSAAFFGNQSLRGLYSFTVTEQNFYFYVDFTPKFYSSTYSIFLEMYSGSGVKLQFGLTSAGKAFIYINKAFVITASGALSLNLRHKVKATQTSGTWKLWVDGSPEATTKTANMTLTSYPWYIGAYNNNTCNFFGLIHEIAFGTSSDNLWVHLTFGN